VRPTGTNSTMHARHPDAHAIRQNVNAARRPSLSSYLYPNMPLLTWVDFQCRFSRHLLLLLHHTATSHGLPFTTRLGQI
jgi:hypothetical protein